MRRHVGNQVIFMGCNPLLDKSLQLPLALQAGLRAEKRELVEPETQARVAGHFWVDC